MEKKIVEKMKQDEKVKEFFSDEELNKFLEILMSNESEAKRQDRFVKLLKEGNA